MTASEAFLRFLLKRNGIKQTLPLPVPSPTGGKLQNRNDYSFSVEEDKPAVCIMKSLLVAVFAAADL